MNEQVQNSQGAKWYSQGARWNRPDDREQIIKDKGRILEAATANP